MQKRMGHPLHEPTDLLGGPFFHLWRGKMQDDMATQKIRLWALFECNRLWMILYASVPSPVWRE
jgi:hypothetical protein